MQGPQVIFMLGIKESSMASFFGHLDPVLFVLGFLVASSTPLLQDAPWLSSQENILGQVHLRWQRGVF